MEATTAALAARLEGRLEGDGERVLRSFATLEDAGPADLAFLANPRYRRHLATTRAGAVLLGPRVQVPMRDDAPTWIRVADPHRGFARLVREFLPSDRRESGIDPRSVCEGQVDGATVMAFSFVGRGARVGAGSVVSPFCYVGAGAVVGRDCWLGPGSVVMDGCVLGDRVRLAPGAVVGADGFGYAHAGAGVPAGALWERMPQMGSVILADDVDVGANSCVDRAALGETRVGAGSKLDNLVQVGHGAQLGPDVVMAACSGIAGSARVGRGTMIGAGAGILGHLEVGSGVQVGAGSMVAKDVPAGGRRSGQPAMEHRTWLRLVASLPEWVARGGPAGAGGAASGSTEQE